MKHKVFVRFLNHIQCFLGTKKIKSYVQGRTEEVASLIDKLMNFPPCVTHSLDELLCQGVKDVAVCVLVMVDSLVSVEAKTYVQDIFKGLHEHHQNKMAFLFWLADSQSVEGVKGRIKSHRQDIEIVT
ncbi:uncharacterized protein LOC122960316 [Acropora millepora]|uniref:uncharacterized protein LOC122960316 n=1 Tax=Acropora millepora TaxID=45264 RepID=UPI001CF48C3C|nr:uncharacterized protein LOC122960316 [Acropora millepora]